MVQSNHERIWIGRIMLYIKASIKIWCPKSNTIPEHSGYDFTSVLTTKRQRFLEFLDEHMNFLFFLWLLRSVKLFTCGDMTQKCLWIFAYISCIYCIVIWVYLHIIINRFVSNALCVNCSYYMQMKTNIINIKQQLISLAYWLINLLLALLIMLFLLISGDLDDKIDNIQCYVACVCLTYRCDATHTLWRWLKLMNKPC